VPKLATTATAITATMFARKNSCQYAPMTVPTASNASLKTPICSQVKVHDLKRFIRVILLFGTDRFSAPEASDGLMPRR
jgi:hypothetical protein